MILIDVVASQGVTMTLTETGLSFSFKFLRVDYSQEASVTEHPVELGAEPTDHVQVRPLRFTVEVLVTASPVGIPDPTAIESARTFLELALGQLCTVVIVGEGTFVNCVLEAAPHAKTLVAERQFSLRFRQIRIAAGLSAPIPARTPAPVASAGAPTEAAPGQQATTAAPESLAHAALALLGLGS